MPNFDKTGPTGNGPIGFGRGSCKGGNHADAPCPRGRGYGAPALTLKEEEKMLTERLVEVRKAIAKKEEA